MKMNWETFRVRLEYPFTISRSTRDVEELVWVRVESDGVEGWGEADPATYYGESVQTVVEALEEYRVVLEEAEELSGPESL
jgi:L-alanine-DL-glutamate epimerase-like enolase superfamily enzyme